MKSVLIAFNDNLLTEKVYHDDSLQESYCRYCWFFSIVGAISLLNGWFSLSKDTHPSGNQLPSSEEAIEALAKDQDLAEEIIVLGGNIEVKIGKSCDNDRTWGLIKVNYSLKTERDAVFGLLTSSEGCRMPMYLVKG